MPILSMFYGLIITMHSESGSQHHIPHIHVNYQGEKYVFDFDGQELNDKALPSNKKKLLDAWLVLHRDELTMNWTLLCNGEAFIKIDPLR